MNFWAVPRSLVTTQGISVDFFSYGYLDISVHRVRLAWLCIHHAILLAEWVSPFGHCRIKACCQLPDTFRRLPRPSSPLTAKASTVCAYSLDHITPSRLGVAVPGVTSSRREYCNDSNKESLDSRLSLYDTSGQSSSQTLATSLVFKERTPASTPMCFQIFVCATQSANLVEPVGIEPTTPCLQSRCSPS